jgi:hypothetical protein
MRAFDGTFRLLSIAGSVLTLGLTGCVHSSTSSRAAPPTPVAWGVPTGCDTNLTGTYRHQADEAFRYRARDDGQVLVLDVERATDGGAVPPRIELRRTTQGFDGRTLGTGLNAARQACTVEFPTSVVSCDEKGLVLQALMTTSVDEACQTAPTPVGAEMQEHRLVRVEAAAAGDASVTDTRP